MSKRFTDTNKYKKTFFRGLPGAYKLLWDYLYHDCDHAGIWHVDMDIAQIFLGKDMPVDESTAISLFNADPEDEKIVVLHGGKKWFIKSFITFQYGELNPQNRAHASVISILTKEGIKPLTSALRGRKDKDMDKDKDKDKNHEPENPESEEHDALSENAWQVFISVFPKRNGKHLKLEAARELFYKCKPKWNQWISAAKNFADSSLVKDGKGICDPINFLTTNWVDWQEAEIVQSPERISAAQKGNPQLEMIRKFKQEQKEAGNE